MLKKTSLMPGMPDTPGMPGMPRSLAVIAEILFRSPQKLFIFIIKKNICWVEESKNKII